MGAIVPGETQGRRCVVIGGGLAGLSAAIALLDAGHHVTLIERRPFLGGRAYSFVDQETGQEVDNGQHVFLGCCTAYMAFIKRLGVVDKTSIQKRLSIPVSSRDGRTSVISAAPWLPSPLHLLPTSLTYRHLTFGERLNTLRVMLRLMRTDRWRQTEQLQAQSFRDWLLVHGEREGAIQRFWNVIVLPTLNDDIAAVSADMGIMVFQGALLKGRHGADVGYARVGLTALLSDAAQRVVKAAGGRMLLGSAVAKLHMDGDRVYGAELASGQVITGDVFVAAVPWDALPKLLPAETAQVPFFAEAQHLEGAPIVGIHIWYDRRVMDDEFAAFVDSPVQWVFNKSRIQGLAGPWQYVCISLSGAWEYATMGKEGLRQLFTKEMAHLFPKARDAHVERFIVVKQLAATFRSKPGAEAFRPQQETPILNLFLAGDWTQTGWPSTMESAVRSGQLAAQAATRGLARQQTLAAQ
ncbi:MAG: FAD-dependent oxidoreductase [Dehalococcoidia bacterium]|nr:FAD-dependent oxidoreductase [Dehalococcoidia bacterium]